MFRFSSLIFALLLFSCGATKETITRVDTLRVPYARCDTLTLTRVDTVYQAGNDRVLLRVDTLFRHAIVRVRDTVTVSHTDTVQTYINKIVDPTGWWVFWHYWDWILLALIFGGAGATVGIFYLIKKFKKV